jgi:hypothetical protein
VNVPIATTAIVRRELLLIREGTVFTASSKELFSRKAEDVLRSRHAEVMRAKFTIFPTIATPSILSKPVLYTVCSGPRDNILCSFSQSFSSPPQ